MTAPATPAFDFAALRERLQPEIDALVGQYEQKRSALIPLAHMFQEHEGYVSLTALEAIGEIVGESMATVESTISFYTLLYRRPVGKYMVQICRNLSCTINGAEEIMTYAREQLGINHLETTDDGLFSYEEVECLAACHRAPCAQVNLEFVYDMTRESVDALIAGLRGGTHKIQPLAQTAHPEKTWRVDNNAATAKAPGALGQAQPNNAGGVGDASGVRMFDLIVGKLKYEQRSDERLLRETGLRPELHQDGHH